MKKQLFKLTEIDVDFSNQHILASYILQENDSHIYIPFDVFLDHLNGEYPKKTFTAISGDKIRYSKFSIEDIEDFSKEFLELQVSLYLNKLFRVKVLAENEELKEEIKITKHCISVVKDHLAILRGEAVLRINTSEKEHNRALGVVSVCDAVTDLLNNIEKFKRIKDGTKNTLEKSV